MLAWNNMLAGGFEDFFIVAPESWGNDPIWFAYIFQNQLR